MMGMAPARQQHRVNNNVSLIIPPGGKRIIFLLPVLFCPSCYVGWFATEVYIAAAGDL